jgi:hypothetical protein
MKLTRNSGVIFLIVALFAGIAGLAPSVQARHGEKSSGYESEGGHGGGDLDSKFFMKAYFYQMHADPIGLSEEQIQKIKNLKKETQKELIRRDADIEILAVDIKDALHEPKIDVEGIHKNLDKKYEIKKERAKYLVRAFANLKGVLSDEQCQKAKDLWLGKKRD